MTDEELRQLVESNSRVIQAMLEPRVTDRLQHEERLRQNEEIIRMHQVRIGFLEENQRQIIQTQRGIANLVASLDDDRPTVLRKLNTIENKLDRIIENQ